MLQISDTMEAHFACFIMKNYKKLASKKKIFKKKRIKIRDLQ